MACFADERSNQIPVLGSSNTRTEFLKRNTAKKIWGFDHEQILMMQKRAGIEISQVPYYLGVSTAMLSSAIEFGAKNIIFVGQDLAYASDGSSHTNGKRNIMQMQTELKQTVIMEIRCIPAWTGWSLKTGLRR